jgi:hypothetical protein
MGEMGKPGDFRWSHSATTRAHSKNMKGKSFTVALKILVDQRPSL